MAEEIGPFEAIYTQRALRYISPDPIPDAPVRKVLDAGIRAPSGGNQDDGEKRCRRRPPRRAPP